MCHQSVGLIQHAIEAAGISTVAVVIKAEITYDVGTPRALWVRFPLGNTFGEPFRVDQQMKITRAALDVLETAGGPREVYELPYRWRRF